VRIPAGRGDGFAAVTLGVDGTCIVSAAASVNGGVRVCARLRRRGSGRRHAASTDAEAIRASVRERAIDPPSDVHASSDYRRHLAEVLAVRAVKAASENLPSERRSLTDVEAGTVSTERSIAVTVNGTTYEREVEARKLLITSFATTST